MTHPFASFPRPFPVEFRSDTYTPDDPGTLPLIFDAAHADEGAQLLLEQFKNQPNTRALLDSLLLQVQDLEVAFWQLYCERRLSNAIGASLDVLGRIVGQARNGMDDDGFRAFVRARILLNRSKGRAQDLAAILVAVVQDPSFAFQIEEYFPSSLALRILDPVPAYAPGWRIASILQLGKPAGTKLFVEFTELDAADTFTLCDTADNSFVDAAKGLGDYLTPATGGGLADVR